MTKKLSLKQAAKAAARMERCLASGDGPRPSMVETLWDMFNDPGTDAKVRLNIANLFARSTLLREQVARKAGLSRFNAGEKKTQTINITIEELKLLPSEQRALLERVYLAQLDSTKPALLPEPTDV